MSNKKQLWNTPGEKEFCAFLDQAKIQYEKIPPEHKPTPDYKITANKFVVYVEVKDIEETNIRKRTFEHLPRYEKRIAEEKESRHNRTLEKIRLSAFAAIDQLKFVSENSSPTMILLTDQGNNVGFKEPLITSAIFGEAEIVFDVFHDGSGTTPAHFETNRDNSVLKNTGIFNFRKASCVSAVGVLDNRSQLHIYVNPIANTPFPVCIFEQTNNEFISVDSVSSIICRRTI